MIYLELELTTRCQLKCPYCCADSPKRRDVYQDEIKLSVIIKTLKKLSEKNDLTVRLMGGEPTLFKFIEELLHYLNTNPRVKLVELYTNLLGKMPKGKYITVATLHIGQYEKFIKNIHKISKLSGLCVVNVMLPKFEGFTWIDELNATLNKLSEDVFVHPQPVAGEADTRDDILKYHALFAQYKEYFKTLGPYDKQLDVFFAKRPIICHPDNYRISESLILGNDCEYLSDCVDLTKNPDLSLVKHNTIVCKHRACYVDNCVYCNML